MLEQRSLANPGAVAYANFVNASSSKSRNVGGGRPNRRLINRNDSPASNRSQISNLYDSDNLRITHLHNGTPHSRPRWCNDPLTSQQIWAGDRV